MENIQSLNHSLSKDVSIQIQKYFVKKLQRNVKKYNIILGLEVVILTNKKQKELYRRAGNRTKDLQVMSPLLYL